MPVLEVVSLGERPSRSLAAWSAAALDRPLAADAQLAIGLARDEARVLGAFQRSSEVEPAAVLVRRGSGGAAFDVGEASVWLVLALREPSAIVSCDAPRIVNRYVRPLLRALTKAGALAHYFGRDWVSSAKRPLAHVGFAYDATSGRSAFEAVIGTRRPFSSEARSSFDGKPPAALVELAPRADAGELVAEISAAYEALARDGGATVVRSGGEAAEAAALVEPSAWSARRADALGVVGAARDAGGRMAIGGALSVARDRLRALEEAVTSIGDRATDPAIVAELVDAHLGAPEAALFGVRDLSNVRDAIVDAARPPLSPRGPR